MKKLLALLFALALAVVCSACSKSSDTQSSTQTAEPDYTPKEVVFEHAHVAVRGAEELEAEGMRITEDVEELLRDVKIVANVPLKQVPYVDASVFDPHIDLTAVHSEGEQQLMISYKQLDPDYGRVISISPESITIHALSDYAPQEITFEHVPVSAQGAETIKCNGFIVTSDLDKLLENVTVVAEVPRKYINDVDVSFFNVRLDLSRIRAAGEQDVEIRCSDSKTYGKVTNITPEKITLNVEDYLIRMRIPINLEVTGDVPDGWYMKTPQIDPILISVSGPMSLVQEVSRGRVFLDMDTINWQEGTIRTTGDIKLYNRRGEEISSPLLTISTNSTTIDNVQIEATILPTKTYSVVDMIQACCKPADGKTANILATPEAITVAAPCKVLNSLEEIALDGLDALSGLSENTIIQLNVLTPSDDAIVLTDVVTVRVDISSRNVDPCCWIDNSEKMYALDNQGVVVYAWEDKAIAPMGFPLVKGMEIQSGRYHSGDMVVFASSEQSCLFTALFQNVDAHYIEMISEIDMNDLEDIWLVTKAGNKVRLGNCFLPSSDEETEQAIYNMVKDAALRCYAVEGQYPEDLVYLREHYGLSYNTEEYIVFYLQYAEDVMPSIRVKWRPRGDISGMQSKFASAVKMQEILVQDGFRDVIIDVSNPEEPTYYENSK